MLCSVQYSSFAYELHYVVSILPTLQYTIHVLEYIIYALEYIIHALEYSSFAYELLCVVSINYYPMRKPHTPVF